MDSKKIELLSPAGCIESFYGAIHAGADAVYLGGMRFGARAYADNFETEDLLACIKYAHMHRRKVYLTVNTLIKEKELDELYDYLLPFCEAGLDGVIVQDIGALLYIRRHFPGLPIHVSTQMNITGKYGARFLRQMGASRIVTARELDFAEIAEIKSQTDIEIETFVHGAMCYCYSGQCLFSSILGGRSGNRGRCAQPCRLPYQVTPKSRQTGDIYPLSLKDLCMLEHIPDLVSAGIDSFKIEGRMKKPEYTAGVTAVYRKYIDRYYQSGQKKDDFYVDKQDLLHLSGLYIRSQKQNGYYFRHNGSDMITLHSPSYKESDEEVLRKIKEQYLDRKESIKIDIYVELCKEKPACITLLSDRTSCPAILYGSIVQEAKMQPVTKENITRQLGKLGDTFFEAENIIISMDENVFFPLKELNELRRKAVSLLEQYIAEEQKAGKIEHAYVEGEADKKAYEASALPVKPDIIGKLAVSIKTWNQFSGFSRWLCTQKQHLLYRVYVEGDLYLSNKADFMKLTARISKKVPVYITFPYIIRKRDALWLEEIGTLLQSADIAGCMIRSVDGYAFLKELKYQGFISGDAGLYIWNRETVHFWKNKLASACLPLELTGPEQRMLLNDILPLEKVVYGRIPMMISANCVLQTTGQCQCQTAEAVCQCQTAKTVCQCQTAEAVCQCQTAVLTDRYRKDFPVDINCQHCMNVIYNSLPLSLHGELHKWFDKAGLRLDFTIENEQEMIKLIGDFCEMVYNRDYTISSKDYTGAGKEYTTGHEKRGVE